MFNMDLFSRIFDFIVMDIEGGGKLHDRGADDPGRLTRYGISQKYHPEVDVANLTEEGARGWYFENVWSPMQCGRLPPGVALVAFDMKVNPTKVASPVLTLQEAVGVTADGNIGPKTIEAAFKVWAGNPQAFLVRVADRRLGGYLGRNDAVEEANEKGWANRVVRVSLMALSWHYEKG